MGCSGMQLHQPQKGFDMHELIRHSTPTPDTKCNGADRIFSVKTGMTRDTCKAQCENTANCKAYTFRGTGFCMGCAGLGIHGFSKNFDMHELTYPSKHGLWPGRKPKVLRGPSLLPWYVVYKMFVWPRLFRESAFPR
jgi:hypothetical protein